MSDLTDWRSFPSKMLRQKAAAELLDRLTAHLPTGDPMAAEDLDGPERPEPRLTLADEDAPEHYDRENYSDPIDRTAGLLDAIVNGLATQRWNEAAIQIALLVKLDELIDEVRGLEGIFELLKQRL